MFVMVGCQNSKVLIYLTGKKKEGNKKTPCLLPINFFALEYKASLNFQHLLDVEAKSLEY